MNRFPVRRRRGASGGFTLVEMMVVVFIIGLLAAVVIPNVTRAMKKARRATATMEIQSFKSALQAFYADNAFFPGTEQGLEALVRKPSVGKMSANYDEGGYLDAQEVPLDPWKNPYVYLQPGMHGGDYDIVSYGADGVEGGEGDDADVESWDLSAR